MPTWYRMRATSPENPQANYDLTLDLLVDENGGLVRKVPFVGWWGKYRSTYVLPVIVQPDGKVDLGSDENTDQNIRFAQTNLHDVEIEESKEFIFSYGDATYRMKIASLNDLTNNVK